jgi:hypothetical protein
MAAILFAKALVNSIGGTILVKFAMNFFFKESVRTIFVNSSFHCSLTDNNLGV